MRRTGEGGTSVDHAEPHSVVESLARHEILVCGFDHTQKIRVYGGAPLPHPASRVAIKTNSASSRFLLGSSITRVAGGREGSSCEAAPEGGGRGVLSVR